MSWDQFERSWASEKDLYCHCTTCKAYWDTVDRDCCPVCYTPGPNLAPLKAGMQASLRARLRGLEVEAGEIRRRLGGAG